MWIKGDRTECRMDITELEWTDNNTTLDPIKVATTDAKTILNKLNMFNLLKDFLDTEATHLDKIINDTKTSPKDLHKAVQYKQFLEYLKNRWYDVVIDEAIENGVLIL